MIRRIKARQWLRGLVGGMIGGAAGAIDSGLALMILDPKDFNLGPALRHTLVTVAVLGLLVGIKSAAFYLKQSPLPPEDEECDPPYNY
jgi:predicted lipid-binding transport protein (Tim44 family)